MNLGLYHNGESKPFMVCQYAKTTMQRMKGLLGTTSLSQTEGLLIEPCNSVHTFGMKYVLDIVYLDRNQKVIKCVSKMAPARMSMAFNATSVVEMAAGMIEANNIKPGDRLEWKPC